MGWKFHPLQCSQLFVTTMLEFSPFNPQHIFLLTVIHFLRLVAPLSIGYILASWYTGRFLYSPWLGAYAVAEAVFYLFVYLPRSRLLQKRATHPPPPFRAEREAIFAKILPHICQSDRATGWYTSSQGPAETIKRDNVKEWLLWALFGDDGSGIQPEWEDELEKYITQIEAFIGQGLEPGRNEDVTSKAFTFDTVKMLHRPLLCYTLMLFLDTNVWLMMRWNGFKHFNLDNWLFCFPPRILTIFSQQSPHPDLGYWYRPHRSRTKRPILFLHGLGMGLWVYVKFLIEVARAEPDVGIIAIEDLPMSMRVTSRHLTREEMLAAVERVLDHHGFQEVVTAGHSYGAILTTHILHDPLLSRRVSASLLVDPVSLLLYRPDLTHNFIYRTPRSTNQWKFWYFACRDPDIARAVQRNWHMPENVLWREDLVGRQVTVVLAERDHLINTEEIWKYLTSRADDPEYRWQHDGLEVLYLSGIDHGEMFETAAWRKPMIQVMSRFVRNALPLPRSPSLVEKQL
ncbi:hypothetical protein AcV5_007432 [Taiwanofungus camphoratus]|nr:hypothetical protein AcV5_007432 [Antrodia cinnamomea]